MEVYREMVCHVDGQTRMLRGVEHRHRSWRHDPSCPLELDVEVLRRQEGGQALWPGTCRPDWGTTEGVGVQASRGCEGGLCPLDPEVEQVMKIDVPGSRGPPCHRRCRPRCCRAIVTETSRRR